MKNSILGKLKDSINKELVLKFDATLLQQMRFVPINIKANCIYIAINQFAQKEDIVSMINKNSDFEARFIQVPDEELEELLKYVLGNSPQIFVEENKDSVDHQVFEDPVTEKKRTVEKNDVAKEPPKKKIGELLIDRGYITEIQLIQALAESKKQQMPLGSALYKLGFITLDQLKETLHEQQGFEMVDSDQLKIQDKVVNILPEDFVKANRVVPISSDGRILVVGMVNPADRKVLKDIVYLTGQKPRAMLITHYEFENIVQSFYNHSKKETKQIIQQIEDESLEFEVEETLWEQVERELADSSGSVAKFVNKIITDAIDTKASDIHIEPRIGNYVVRYRTDGILKHIVDIPIKVEQSVLTRFKVLSRMNIAEHRRPQDGTFSIKYKGSSYDFRINTLPVGSKEKVVIRVLAPAVSLKGADRNIELFGGTAEDIEKITKMVSCPNGIILTSGPTGSGKTTTLYSVLKSLNNEDVNITTIEDPVEIKLEGINQSQVNAKAGITFASCMRAILRQDPDIILVGEIRDYETLEVAISAALTGHLVLSTVHTNSAAATVTRLIEMGAKDYLVSSTLSGVIAQRLVRKLCDDCKEVYYPSYEEAKKVLMEEEIIQWA
jgi:type IV pilus assembly protein PilB